MGQKDILCKTYMSNPIHFAEAFNFFLHKGNPRIDPEDLSPLDTTEIAVPYGNGAYLPVQKFRDVLKQWKTMTDGKALYTVLGIENQSNDEELLQYIPDYKIHLITPYNMKDEDFEKFYTDFGKLLKYIKYSKDEKALYEITHESDFYQSIDTDSALLMNEMTGSKLQLNEEGGKVNMCKAIDDMRLHCREEGKAEGKEETRLEAIKNIMESFSVTAQQAMESLKIPSDEYPKYMAQL